MIKPVVVTPDDDHTTLGVAFGTPVVVKGWSWLPMAEVLVAGFLAWYSGRRRRQLAWDERLIIGALSMPVVLGSEWAHNFAHAAAARLVGKPMDAIRITWGTPLCVYYDLHDPDVSPGQHILRALGGPVLNALLLPLAWLARRRTQPETVAREVADAAVATNAFLCTASLLPVPGIDGGPILKWGLVARGRSAEEADRVVKRVNGVISLPLGLAAGVAFRWRKGLLGALLAQFAALALAIALGWVREE